MNHLGAIEFGKQLIQTGDLDPIYIMLHNSTLPIKQKQRWCVAYWLFYHAGVASCASEFGQRPFWRYLKSGYSKFPRGTERRHFRGQSGLVALTSLEKRYPVPEEFVRYVSQQYFSQVVARVTEHHLFGPWIAFKIADMLERILGQPVDFSDCDLLNLYREPRAGAELLAEKIGLLKAESAITVLQTALGYHLAPPGGERRVGMQELETILCKWKAHVNGHYPVGKDTREIDHALRLFPCDTSQHLGMLLREGTRLPGLL